MPLPEPQKAEHSIFEDIQALLFGSLFVAMAVVLFRQAGLFTGGYRRPRFSSTISAASRSVSFSSSSIFRSTSSQFAPWAGPSPQRPSSR